MPSLPVDDIDVLIIDEMGKNISGAGMDTNIIGRWMVEGEPEPESPRIKRIAILDLTPESHGNATTYGLADFMSRKLFDKIDFPITMKNMFTSGFLTALPHAAGLRERRRDDQSDPVRCLPQPIPQPDAPRRASCASRTRWRWRMSGSSANIAAELNGSDQVEVGDEETSLVFAAGGVLV